MDYYLKNKFMDKPIQCASNEDYLNFKKYSNFYLYMQEKKIDFSKYDSEPVYYQIKKIMSCLISYNFSYEVIMALQLNTVNTTDEYIQIKDASYSGTFYNTESIEKHETVQENF